MDYTSIGKGNAALTTGIIGTSLGALNSGLLGNLFGGNCGCSENMAVSRYELGMEKELAAKDSEIGLLKSTIHTDGKILELYQYVDGRLRGIEGQIAQQAVVNSQITANISCMQGNIATLMALTKTVVPIDSICPAPMPQFNSWTAPTAGT